MRLPAELYDLVGYRYPDYLWLASECHGPGVYTLWILDLDYSYNEWLATLSLDGRWTLSPRSGPCYSFETSQGLPKAGETWRGIAGTTAKKALKRMRATRR